MAGWPRWGTLAVTGMCCWEGSGRKAGSAGLTGLGLAFACLPLLAAPSLFPFKGEPALAVPSLCTVAEGKRSPSLFHLFNFGGRLVGKCPSMSVLTTT